MRFPGILDRLLFREWAKTFFATAIGFPLFVIIIDVVEKLDEYLSRGVPPSDIALSYVYAFPEYLNLVLPAAVLFATVFTIGAFSRHSELTAAKASGRSFYRAIVPLVVAAVAATALGLVVGEMSPAATVRRMELIGEREQRNEERRFNFVYRADEGWVYVITSLDATNNVLRDLQFEREGTGIDYPTFVVQSRRASYDDSVHQWTIDQGRFRLLTGASADLTFEFDSMLVSALDETPDELLAEPKRPEEMDYRELGEYIDALERSGGDGGKLRVGQALKIAIPFTCLVIAIFAAPLAVTAPRGSGAVGIGIGLGTTIMFLLFVQLSQGIGSSGIIPPTVAAWIPNALFGLVGIVLMTRVRT